MARHIPISPTHQHFPFFPTFLILISVFSVFSIVTFLCGSHLRKQHKTVRLGNNKPSSSKSFQSSISNKAVQIANMMISCRNIQDLPIQTEEDEDEDEDAVVWRRTIIKGEKCRPLEFSGKILYDCDGNLLPNSPSDRNLRDKGDDSLRKS